MLNELDIEVHFALPYNAQTKPIERDFNKLKEWLSKHCVGYRGGNVIERPEKLANEIKNDKIIDFEDFKNIFDKFITNVFILLIRKILLSFLLHTINRSVLVKIQLYVLNYVVNFI